MKNSYLNLLLDAKVAEKQQIKRKKEKEEKRKKILL